jgi:hypothetical protein
MSSLVVPIWSITNVQLTVFGIYETSQMEMKSKVHNAIYVRMWHMFEVEILAALWVLDLVAVVAIVDHVNGIPMMMMMMMVVVAIQCCAWTWTVTGWYLQMIIFLWKWTVWTWMMISMVMMMMIMMIMVVMMMMVFEMAQRWEMRKIWI